VQFTPEELKTLEETTTHSIDIGKFVSLESVDPVYFDGTYYLAPDKGGAKPYSLPATALTNLKQCAVGRGVSRGKEHIVIIRPVEGRTCDASTAFPGRGAQYQRIGCGVRHRIGCAMTVPPPP
jgi:non-homologous end joining protein Ku